MCMCVCAKTLATVEEPSKETDQQQPVSKIATAHAITHEEFNSVSNVVRGRCKLEECNALLEQVCEREQEEEDEEEECLLCICMYY